MYLMTQCRSTDLELHCLLRQDMSCSAREGLSTIFFHGMIYLPAGSEGRAGMAALHLENDLQPTPKVLEQIFHHCQENLPAYAVPLFLRFPKENALTTTLKQQKTQYRKEGYSPELVTDPLFYLDAEKKTYSPLSVDSLQQYMAKARL